MVAGVVVPPLLTIVTLLLSTVALKLPSRLPPMGTTLERSKSPREVDVGNVTIILPSTGIGFVTSKSKYTLVDSPAVLTVSSIDAEVIAPGVNVTELTLSFTSIRLPVEVAV